MGPNSGSMQNRPCEEERMTALQEEIGTDLEKPNTLPSLVKQLWNWKVAVFLVTAFMVVLFLNVSIYLVLQSVFHTTANSVEPHNFVTTTDCGGIINIPARGKGYIAYNNYTSWSLSLGNRKPRCAWIVKSEAKAIKAAVLVVRPNKSHLSSKSQTSNDWTDGGLLVAEMGGNDDKFQCPNWVNVRENITLTTPAIIYFTSWSSSDGFVLEINPIESSGSHADQPNTYHISDRTKGSLPFSVISIRRESLLGSLVVFQPTMTSSTPRRNFSCSCGERELSCDFVEAYKINTFTRRSSLPTCRELIGLSSGGVLTEGDSAVIMLFRLHHGSTNSDCHITWDNEIVKPTPIFSSVYGSWSDTRIG